MILMQVLDLSYGFNRAKLAWYSIDPIFYTQRPTGISNDDLSLNKTKEFSVESYIHLLILHKDKRKLSFDLTYFHLKEVPQ
jgi:cell surface protein SprA